MLQRLFLLFISGSIAIIAFLYGISPQWFATTFLDITGELGRDFSNILRATMCLYLAFGTFWFVAIFVTRIRSIAVLTVAIFTGGVAIGRLLSMFLDGEPSMILLIYTAMEIATSILAYLLFKRENGM